MTGIEQRTTKKPDLFPSKVQIRCQRPPIDKIIQFDSFCSFKFYNSVHHIFLFALIIILVLVHGHGRSINLKQTRHIRHARLQIPLDAMILAARRKRGYSGLRLVVAFWRFERKLVVVRREDTNSSVELGRISSNFLSHYNTTIDCPADASR